MPVRHAPQAASSWASGPARTASSLASFAFKGKLLGGGKRGAADLAALQLLQQKKPRVPDYDYEQQPRPVREHEQAGPARGEEQEEGEEEVMARWAAAGLLSESPEDSKGEQPPPSPPVPTTQRQRQQQVTAPAPDRPWQPDLRPRDDDTYAEMGSMQSSLDATQGQLPATHLPHGQQLGSWGAPEPGRPQPSPGGQPALLQPGSGGRGCSKPAVAEGPQAWGQYLGDSGGGGGEEGRASRPLLPPGLPKAGGPKQQLERGPLLHGPGPVERFGEGPGKGAAGGGGAGLQLPPQQTFAERACGARLNLSYQQQQQQQQQAVQQVQQQAPAQQQQQQADDLLLDDMLGPPQGGMNEMDIEMESPTMDTGEIVLSASDDEVLKTLFATQESQDAEQAQQQQGQQKQAGMSRTASANPSTRTIGTRPTSGVSKVGGAQSPNAPGSAESQLSNLWASAPDVREAFGIR